MGGTYNDGLQEKEGAWPETFESANDPKLHAFNSQTNFVKKNLQS